MISLDCAVNQFLKMGHHLAKWAAIRGPREARLHLASAVSSKILTSSGQIKFGSITRRVQHVPMALGFPPWVGVGFRASALDGGGGACPTTSPYRADYSGLLRYPARTKSRTTPAVTVIPSTP